MRYVYTITYVIYDLLVQSHFIVANFKTCERNKNLSFLCGSLYTISDVWSSILPSDGRTPLGHTLRNKLHAGYNLCRNIKMTKCSLNISIGHLFLYFKLHTCATGFVFCIACHFAVEQKIQVIGINIIYIICSACFTNLTRKCRRISFYTVYQLLLV